MAQQVATNITWHDHKVSKPERARLNGHAGAVLWFTGLSACGKSTIANTVDHLLHSQGRHTYVLDGDNIRHGLNKNLGFSAADRAENIRRIGEVAKLFADSGLIALTSFISPYRKDRDAARKIHEQNKAGAIPFIEVFVDTPIETCETRDPKGLYKQAREAVAAGKGMGFTGVDDPYEAPHKPEITVDASKQSVEESVAVVLNYLIQRGLVAE